MGNTSSMLTQYDIEEVQEHCSNTFSQQEIVSLYQRFCQLDRNGCGFISAEEFMTVPEFAVNPLSQRLFRMLDGLNFKEFVAFLSAFSSRASLQQKVEFIFKVYDTDGNGKVTFNEMLDILRDLTEFSDLHLFLVIEVMQKENTPMSLKIENLHKRIA
ncbi:Calcineurin subunit B [Sesamum angolense]|uniref:Calcineurin subunit B n=1 Tax=Sesamum angolense TaxID=2727404 RepID=A0AAE1T850_9LAMI|nr:Calcineurin subunit B [Sesamum angolense]